MFQIIVRPATVFGAEDRFLNWIAEGSCRMPFFPLINDGNALVQPVYCGDVGKALMNITYVSHVACEKLLIIYLGIIIDLLNFLYLVA